MEATAVFSIKAISKRTQSSPESMCYRNGEAVFKLERAFSVGDSLYLVARCIFNNVACLFAWAGEKLRWLTYNFEASQMPVGHPVSLLSVSQHLEGRKFEI